MGMSSGNARSSAETQKPAAGGLYKKKPALRRAGEVLLPAKGRGFRLHSTASETPAGGRALAVRRAYSPSYLKSAIYQYSGCNARSNWDYGPRKEPACSTS